ncbi:MAG: tetratricopeptide repeat protein [Planctomycetaceae bacterium]|nr:tetratricopeptide repeat protein [Planctomycetaceae bacterium]
MPDRSRTDIQPGRSLILRIQLWLACVAFVIAVFAAVHFLMRLDLPEGLSRTEFDRAASHFREQYGSAPDRDDTLHWLAKRSLQEGNLDVALACLRGIGWDHPQYGLTAKLSEGELLIQLNRAVEAETCFRTFLERTESRLPSDSPYLATAWSWLCYLYSIELRFEERKELLTQLHRTGRASINESKQLFFPSLLIWNSARGRERLNSFLSQTSDAAVLNIAKGRYLTGEGELAQAQSHLELWQERLNNDPSCTAALLECLYEQNDWTAFEEVLKDASVQRDEEPWLLLLMRGHDAIHKGEWNEAVQRYSAVLDRDPSNSPALMGLAQAYRELGQEDRSKSMLDRVATLAVIRPRLSSIRESNLDAVEELAEKCDTLKLSEAARTFRAHAERVRREQRPETISPL